MKFFILSVAMLVVGVAYILRTPVPDGLTEPFKYRLLVGMARLQGIAAKLCAIFQPSNELAYVQSLRTIREMMNSASPSEVKGSNIRSKVTTFDGVRVRLYEPIKKEKGLQPAIIFIHGGGMAFGSADGYDRRTRDLAERANMFLVSIDYRLAPEHPFPAGHTDCLRATTWLLRHAEEYGVDSSRVAISGDSAGGYFSATVAQVVNDDPSLPNLRMQVLIYPGLQAMDFITSSYQKYKQDFGVEGILPASKVAFFWCLYLKGSIDFKLIEQLLTNQQQTRAFRQSSPMMKYIDHDVIPASLRQETKNYISPKQRTDEGNETLWKSMKDTLTNPKVAPIFRENLSGLPQAFVLTCGFDSIRDDGIFYAKRLEMAGVNTTWKHYESGFHAVMFISSLFWFDLGDRMTQDVADFIKNNI